MQTKWRYLLYVWLVGTFGFFAFTISTRPDYKPVVFDSEQTIDSYLADKGEGAALSFGSFSDMIQTTREKLTESILGAEDALEEKIIKPKPYITGTYTIAILGDSMVEVLGPEVSILKQELTRIYPDADINIVNSSEPGRDIEEGLRRLTNNYSYSGNEYLATMAHNPNILVIESFAYNHWSDSKADLDRHWLTIANIINTARTRNPDIQIILATTIAPHCPTYTDGSANLPDERKYVQCETVKKYLQNMVNFATGENYPLANAYNDSIIDGEGNTDYIGNDNIHPSGEGGEFFAKKLVEQVVKQIQ